MIPYPCRSSAARDSRICRVAGDSGRKGVSSSVTIGFRYIGFRVMMSRVPRRKEMRLWMMTLFLASAACAAEEGVEQTIRGLYTASRAAARDARTKEEMRRAFDTFAPEWVGNMPAGE